MTPADYRAMCAADVARKTLAVRCRSALTAGEASSLLGEAADAIDHLYAVIDGMRREARVEAREAQRDARDAAAEGYWQGRQESEGSYGSY